MGTLTDPSFIDGETETQGNEVTYRPTASKQWTGMWTRSSLPERPQPAVF